MMTRKDYEKAAAIVAQLDWPEDAELACYCFTALFQPDNPRFDVGWFKEACGLRVGGKPNEKG